MTNHGRAATVAALLFSAIPSATRADGPGPEPAPFYDGSWGGPGRVGAPARSEATDRRPTRRVTGGPDYVGSDYGLGKPSFYGIGSRPDWGRSSAD